MKFTKKDQPLFCTNCGKRVKSRGIVKNLMGKRVGKWCLDCVKLNITRENI